MDPWMTTRKRRGWSRGGLYLHGLNFFRGNPFQMGESFNVTTPQSGAPWQEGSPRGAVGPTSLRRPTIRSRPTANRSACGSTCGERRNAPPPQHETTAQKKVRNLRKRAFGVFVTRSRGQRSPQNPTFVIFMSFRCNVK